MFLHTEPHLAFKLSESQHSQLVTPNSYKMCFKKDRRILFICAIWCSAEYQLVTVISRVFRTTLFYAIVSCGVTTIQTIFPGNQVSNCKVKSTCFVLWHVRMSDIVHMMKLDMSYMPQSYLLIKEEFIFYIYLVGHFIFYKGLNDHVN